MARTTKTNKINELNTRAREAATLARVIVESTDRGFGITRELLAAETDEETLLLDAADYFAGFIRETGLYEGFEEYLDKARRARTIENIRGAQ